MGIDVVVRQHPCGDVVASLADVVDSVPPPRPPTKHEFVIPDGEEQRFPLLRGVEPYGSACFNRRQAVHLAAELERLQPLLHGPQLSLARALQVLIAFQMGKQHRSCCL
jgi:hypothetical protein